MQRDDEELELEVTLGARFTFQGRFTFPPGEFPRLPEWPSPPEGWPLPPEWGWPQERPYLGMRIRQLEEGAEVLKVVPASPAEKAGLRAGDLILALDGEEVTREAPLVGLIAAYEPGDTVVLTIERDGREREMEVELGEWPLPEEPGAVGEGAALGTPMEEEATLESRRRADHPDPLGKPGGAQGAARRCA